MHIGRVAGYEHVGLGADFDGIPLASTPSQLEDVSKYPRLMQVLRERGLSDSQLIAIMGGNLLRVWTQVEDMKKL